MPKERKRRLGRPKLPKAQVKGKIVPVRFAAEDLDRILRAARANNQNVSQWIRSTLREAAGYGV